MVNPWKKTLSCSRIALLRRLINEVVRKTVDLDHNETLYLSRRNRSSERGEAHDEAESSRPSTDSHKLSRKEKPVHYSGWPAFIGEPEVAAVTEGAPCFDRSK